MPRKMLFVEESNSTFMMKLSLSMSITTDIFTKKELCKQEIKTQRGFNKSFNKLIIKRLKKIIVKHGFLD